MKVLIVDNGTKYLHQLVRLTSRLHPKIKTYRELEVSDEDSYDLIILSGGHDFSVAGNERILSKEISLVKNSKTPILGICFGFELIASVYHAILAKMNAKERTILEISKVVDDSIFEGVSNIRVFESHRWVVRNVGKSLIALASSKDGIEIIKHKSKNIYGFQFHPEMFVNMTEGDELFANFIGLVIKHKTL